MQPVSLSVFKSCQSPGSGRTTHEADPAKPKTAVLKNGGVKDDNDQGMETVRSADAARRGVNWRREDGSKGESESEEVE